ncbi:uncharacterized protein K452DRAFT_157210 [Aplosporella prunicola CBS 121167]|uniref:Uncharacterized protein n=1 Tax=Aplosporella prunicola CBS 121167 TaxID=1176127 RepID=A0A6A6AYT0_9PEZI|nr:uncharacterized protein K452DRAFT_157210 [Aplosporella prunicola CBS 121167]KAF2135927.1 hypothetical protein K452DRAFT_157210 [Aplosporella prunicola CBS 121167]
MVIVTIMRPAQHASKRARTAPETQRAAKPARQTGRQAGRRRSCVPASSQRARQRAREREIEGEESERTKSRQANPNNITPQSSRQSSLKYSGQTDKQKDKTSGINARSDALFPRSLFCDLRQITNSKNDR